MESAQQFFAHNESLQALVNVFGLLAGIVFLYVALKSIAGFVRSAYQTSIKRAIAQRRRYRIAFARWLSQDLYMFEVFAFKQLCRSAFGLILMVFVLVSAASSTQDVAIPNIVLEWRHDHALLRAIIRTFVPAVFMTLATKPLWTLYSYSSLIFILRTRYIRRSYFKRM